jgi:hypothetical protein
MDKDTTTQTYKHLFNDDNTTVDKTLAVFADGSPKKLGITMKMATPPQLAMSCDELRGRKTNINVVGDDESKVVAKYILGSRQPWKKMFDYHKASQTSRVTKYGPTYATETCFFFSTSEVTGCLDRLVWASSTPESIGFKDGGKIRAQWWNGERLDGGGVEAVVAARTTG